MEKITVKGCIIVPQAKLEAIKEALIEHTALTREETGCLVFDVTQRTDDPLVFDLYEEFVDDAAFSAHQARAKLTRWADISADVKRDFDVTRG